MVTEMVIKIPIIEGVVLGVSVVRGYAPLSVLARISRPDVYDVEKNPKGTQRDLNPKHAKDAYDYVVNELLAFWPEVFLCVRDPSVVKVVVQSQNCGYLQIDDEKIGKSKVIKISRVDGNHRLFYADGHDGKLPAIEKVVSFCLALGLTRDQEIKLFRDINNNQRRMNTSHLDNIALRLSSADGLRKEDPLLYLTSRLADDDDSPFYGKIYLGGKPDAKRFIPLRNLKTGLTYMFSRPTRLSAVDDAGARLVLIKNFFEALKTWQPGAWNKPRDHIMLRGAGFWAVCFLGAEVIDRALAVGKYKPKDMLKILKSGKDWDWGKEGDFSGYSGRGGAVTIRDKIVAELEDEGGVSLKSIVQKISSEI